MLRKTKFYINGDWTDAASSNDFDVINPANEEPFAVISLGTKCDVDMAVSSATHTFDTWKDV